MIRRVLTAGAALATGSYGFALYVNDDLDDLALPRVFSWQRTANSAAPKPKLVVLGSGWGSMSLIRKLDLDHVDLTVVSPRPFFFYTPLLAGTATGTISQENICESVRKSIVKGSGSSSGRYIQASCSGVNFTKKTVTCRMEGEGEEVQVPYDKLVIAVGAAPATFGIKGVEENAMFLKEVEHGVQVRSRVLGLIEKASSLSSLGGSQQEIDRLLHFVVVGGGPTGTELCGELSDLIQKDVAASFPDIAKRVRITLLEGLPRILNMFDKGLSDYAHTHLIERDVDVKTNVFVTEVEQKRAIIKHKGVNGSDSLDFGMLVWAAGITTRGLVRDLIQKIGNSQGQTSRRGLVVDEWLRVKGIEDVYAIGDCAFSGLPPTAQVASQQGKFLGRLFRDEFQRRQQDGDAAVLQQVIPAFSYNDKGKMAYIGGGEGVVEMKLGLGRKSDYEFWRAIHGAVGEPRLAGSSGFMLWRSVYFSMLLSMRNRLYIGMDWARTYLFGRDITAATLPDAKQQQQQQQNK